MNFVSNEELRKIINESVNNVLKEAGAPVPVGGGAPRPVGGGAPRPVGGGAPRPVGGGAPRPVGGGAPRPVGGGAPRPVGSGAPRPVGGGAPAPVGGGAPSVASSTQSNVSQDADADEVKGGVDKNGKHKPGILTARYEPFYETKDPSQTDQQVFKMWLTYINQQACNRFVTFLNQNYGDIVFSPLPLHDPTCRIPKNLKKGDGSAIENGFNQYWVKIVIRPGKKDEFIQKVPEIVDGLYAIFDEIFSPSKPRRGRPFQGNPGKIAYDDSYKPKFAQYIIDFVNKTPSPEEVQSVEIKIAQNLKELLAHLNDPQVQQRIGMIRMIVASPTRKQLQNFLQNHDLQDQNGVLSGWLLSERNAAKVLAQNPNATYIAQEHIWRAWGHEIVDPNDFVLVNMPTTWKTFDEKAFDRACKEMGFPGGANEYRYKKKNGLINLAGQQKAALDHFENLYNPGKTNFGLYKFYDVSNTKVIPGLVSKFLPGAEQDPGLSNNLQGAVNTAAGGNEVFQAADAQPSADTDNENGLPMTSPEDVKMFKDALQAITINETGSAPSGLGTSDEHDIVLLAYHYADFLQRSQYKSMIPETAELFKKGFAAGIATSIGIKDTEGANYLSTALSSTGKDTKIEQLAAKWFQDYLDLLIDIQKEIDAKASKASGKKSYKKVVEEDALNESFGIKTLNFDEFKKLLHIDELEGYNAQDDLMSNQQLKESFFSFLDRMDGEYEQ